MEPGLYASQCSYGLVFAGAAIPAFSVLSNSEDGENTTDIVVEIFCYSFCFGE